MAQHTQIGMYSSTINKHGVRIEHSRWEPSALDEQGRCCGRKAHQYKTKTGFWKTTPDPHSCCFKCNREYGPDGKQRPNYAYTLGEDGNYSRDEPKGPA